MSGDHLKVKFKTMPCQLLLTAFIWLNAIINPLPHPEVHPETSWKRLVTCWVSCYLSQFYMEHLTCSYIWKSKRLICTFVCYSTYNDFWIINLYWQAVVAKSKKDLQRIMEDLCEARRVNISQIQKYLFLIQVNPVLQELCTPPSRDATDFSKGTHLQHKTIFC